MSYSSLFPPKYFPQVFVVKALVQEGEKFLLIQEPETSSWKPGKWGLPGGKVDPGEDWLTALHREMQEEVEVKVEPSGIVSIQEIIFPNPRVENQLQLTHHVILLAKLAPDQKISARHPHRWQTLAELHQLPADQATEDYFPQLWQKIAALNFSPVPLDLFQICRKVDDPEFERWFRS
jgi:ADP-ribose pyrophosphatase YjhB (NUDIX family)